MDIPFLIPPPEVVKQLQKQTGKSEQEIIDAFARANQALTEGLYGSKNNGQKKDEKRFTLDLEDIKPREIYEYINQFVISQEEAKITISDAVAYHYKDVKRIKQLRDQGKHEEAEQISKILQKENVLIMGPTGCGKTYIVKKAAERLKVPFMHVDATKYTEAGYVGGDVEDIIRGLIQNAGGDVQAASYGIVYIDEIDKIASSGRAFGPDVSREGVQRALLTIMEEAEVPIADPRQPQVNLKEMMGGKSETPKTINTRNILFIFGGSFQGIWNEGTQVDREKHRATGLESIVMKRLGAAAGPKMGFGAIAEEPEQNINYLSLAQPEDLQEFGFIPEFIGRIPIRTYVNPLEKHNLIRILNGSKESIIKKYIMQLESFGINLTFDAEAIDYIAEKAAAQSTGARALPSVIEQIMKDFKFELPSIKGVTELKITRNIAQNPRQGYLKLFGSFPYDQYCSEFKSEFDVQLIFDEDSISYINRLSEERGENPYVLVKRLFHDSGVGYGFRALGVHEFRIDKENVQQIIDKPQQYFEEHIKKVVNGSR